MSTTRRGSLYTALGKPLNHDKTHTRYFLSTNSYDWSYTQLHATPLWNPSTQCGRSSMGCVLTSSSQKFPFCVVFANIWPGCIGWVSTVQPLLLQQIGSWRSSK